MRILAFDPGGVTGVAWWNGSILQWRELFGTYESQAQEIFNYVWDCEPDVVVCESYTITARTAQLSQQHEPLMIIGLLRFMCRKDEPQFVMQSPAQAKSFATDDKLHAINWYHQTAGGHANDAIRHLLVYMASHQLLDTDTLKKLVAA